LRRLRTRNYACWVQRHLDKETEQVRSTWSRYRGGRGTCVGVSDDVGVRDERAWVTPVTIANYSKLR
jgi:hypothetical protein